MARAVFELLEQRFGRLADLVESRDVHRVATSASGHLERGHLEQLIRHEVAAVHVKGFVEPTAAAALSRRILARDAAATAASGATSRELSWKVANGRGMESTDVRAVGGTPFAVAMDAARSDPARLDAYFEEAAAEIRWLRRGDASDVLSPLDKLRLELDEAWPNGCTLLKDAKLGRPFLPGVGRVMEGPTAWAEGFAHVDSLDPMVADSGLFSANIYLQLPPVGGELQIWPLRVRSRWDFYRHGVTWSALTTPDEGGQRTLRKALAATIPPLRLRPAPGDLVLLCAQRPHAVQGFPLGRRVSLQSFVTHAEGKPLTIDN